MGEPRDSVRRGHTKGIEWHYQLNPGDPARRIDLILLDERWNRSPSPCFVRRDWCEKIVMPNEGSILGAWCRDFLEEGGSRGTGSCCRAEEDFALGFCARAPKKPNDPLWRSACDPWSVEYGRRAVKIEAGDVLRSIEEDEEPSDPDTLSMPFCEVLGIEQRMWLESVIAGSRAPFVLVASGSNVLNRPSGTNTVDNDFAGIFQDTLDGFPSARNNLLAQLSRAQGCVVILTGDMHFSDIKRITGEAGTSAAQFLGSGGKLRKPIWQIMSSGMTHSTAKHVMGCADPVTQDPDGLRVGGPCQLEHEPSFGMVEVDAARNRAHLQVIKATGKLSFEVVIDLGTCQQV